MKAEKFVVQACCGKTSIMFKTDTPITTNTLKSLVNLGFIEAQHFTQSGILYVDNQDLIITGPIGSDRLQVKCKKSNCNQKVQEFEALLPQLE